MSRNIDFYVDINDLPDIDVALLKKDIKDEGIKGKVVLVEENEHKVLVLFFETDDGVSFYNWSAPVGFSREYKAKTLDAATSKAECMSMYFTPTGMIKATDVNYGQKDINKKKLGIDYPLERFPKEGK